ncbi:MAG: hypothetical protein GVY32_05065 [Gammaproteobacteria bacterium]|jgi:hypothetical protein|nr:hypothetical protein [Gammaproteobacteria bacterium]
MNPVKSRRLLVGLLVALSLALVGCELDRPPRADTSAEEASVLRVHDVSDLQVEGLEGKLNELLSREDLPLRGRVELLDDGRLAVNASRHLQDEIAGMIEQLRESVPADIVERPFRIEFWFLRLAPGESSGDLPAYLADELAPLVAQYEDYGLSIQDYLESHHSSASSMRSIYSGSGALVRFRRVVPTEQGILLNASTQSDSAAGRRSIIYEIDHVLQPGKSLVLGRAHDGGDAGKASYQLLVARAEWTDEAD